MVKPVKRHGNSEENRDKKAKKVKINTALTRFRKVVRPIVLAFTGGAKSRTADRSPDDRHHDDPDAIVPADSSSTRDHGAARKRSTSSIRPLASGHGIIVHADVHHCRHNTPKRSSSISDHGRKRPSKDHGRKRSPSPKSSGSGHGSPRPSTSRSPGKSRHGSSKRHSASRSPTTSGHRPKFPTKEGPPKWITNIQEAERLRHSADHLQQRVMTSAARGRPPIDPNDPKTYMPSPDDILRQMEWKIAQRFRARADHLEKEASEAHLATMPPDFRRPGTSSVKRRSSKDPIPVTEL